MSAPAKPVVLYPVSYQVWAECSGCGWKQWVDLAVTNVRADFEPPRPPRLSIEAMIDSLPADLFRPHRCEVT